jgi:hypothetical protein
MDLWIHSSFRKRNNTGSHVSLKSLTVGLTRENKYQLTKFSWETKETIVNKNINSLVSKY